MQESTLKYCLIFSPYNNVLLNWHLTRHSNLTETFYNQWTKILYTRMVYMYMYVLRFTTTVYQNYHYKYIFGENIYSFMGTVTPVLLDHPVCHIKVVISGRWSFKTSSNSCTMCTTVRVCVKSNPVMQNLCFLVKAWSFQTGGH